MSVEKCSRSRFVGDHLGEAGLVDRDLAGLQARDLVGVDVDAVDVAAELREARRGDEPDVAGADDADRFDVSSRLMAARGDGSAAPTRCSDRAMSSICRFVSVCESVLETQ